MRRQTEHIDAGEERRLVVHPTGKAQHIPQAAARREALQCRALRAVAGKDGAERHALRPQPAQRRDKHLEALLGDEASHRANDRRLCHRLRSGGAGGTSTMLGM